jgi:hypothetical protein
MKYIINLVVLIMLSVACDSKSTNHHPSSQTLSSNTKASSSKTVEDKSTLKSASKIEKNPAVVSTTKDSNKSGSDEILYYTGTYATTSPDGKTPFGPPIAIVAKRTLQKDKNLILEVLDMPKKHFEVILTRTKGGSFTGTDQEKSWTGLIVYFGPEWKWNEWTYDIKLSDGSGTLKGKGSLTAGILKTEKIFYDLKGTPQARILETLIATTAKEYATQLKLIKNTK